jgi:hypothetical protein
MKDSSHFLLFGIGSEIKKRPFHEPHAESHNNRGMNFAECFARRERKHFASPAATPYSHRETPISPTEPNKKPSNNKFLTSVGYRSRRSRQTGETGAQGTRELPARDDRARKNRDDWSDEHESAVGDMPKSPSSQYGLKVQEDIDPRGIRVTNGPMR